MMLTEWAVGEVFWAMLWFTLFFMWIWLVISIFADIFRSDDMNGWVKALWCVFIIVLPFLGVLVYLIARGDRMRSHAIGDARAQDEATRAYIQQAAGTTSSPAAELEKLANLRSQGVIDEAEFQAMKAKIVA